MADAMVKADATTRLLNLATDCLRLSMHFFHPIQQSAPHVYHTALPLSPTSSLLRKSCLQNVIDNQVSHVAAFPGASGTWGLLLRTIDVRPRQLSCIATSAQGIIAACGDIVNVFDAITFVLRQSIRAPETVAKIRDSPDGSTLFFAHSSSVTMWDMQTGGLIRIFSTGSEIQDMAVSTLGNHLACGLPGGAIAFWNIHSKEEGKSFKIEQPVIAIHWFSHQVLVVATQGALHTHDIIVGKITGKLSIPGRVWGMAYLQAKGEFLVGITKKSSGRGQEESFFLTVKYAQIYKPRLRRESRGAPSQSPAIAVRLSNPVLVGGEIACITAAGGVQPFNTELSDWTKRPPLLDTALSVGVSLNRNLVVQTEDSIQIFSVDVLTSREAHDVVRSYHIYPLGENYIICTPQPNTYPTLLKLETLREARPDGYTSSSGSSFADMGKLRLLVSKWMREGDGVRLSGLSPQFTRIVTVNGSLRQICINDARDGTTTWDKLRDELGVGEVYGVAFGSETRFYLKIDGPGRHIQIPFDIVEFWSEIDDGPLHGINMGDPEFLSEPRITSPYTLDANCEWVLDAESRRICWISPGNVRRGKGGHFWTGSSLVMVGDDGIVRKLTFKQPDR